MSWLDRLKANAQEANAQEANALAGNCQNRRNSGYVSFVSAVETNIPAARCGTDAQGNGEQEAFEERAAIMEFDGGL